MDWPQEALAAVGLTEPVAPLGAAWLVSRLGLAVLPHHRWSYVAASGAAREFEGTHGRVVIYRRGFREGRAEETGTAPPSLSNTRSSP